MRIARPTLDGLLCRVNDVDLNRPISVGAGPLRINSLDQRSENFSRCEVHPLAIRLGAFLRVAHVDISHSLSRSGHSISIHGRNSQSLHRLLDPSWTQRGKALLGTKHPLVFAEINERASGRKLLADALGFVAPALFCTSAAIACPAARTCSKQPTARETWLPAPERAACCSNVRSVVHTSVGADAQRRHLQQQASVTHGSGQPAITHVAPYFSQLRTAVTGGSQLTLDTHLIS